MHGMPHTAPVALITGAAKRVGAAIARRLHGAGYELALHYRDSVAEINALQAELDAIRPGSTLTLRLDLGRIAQLPALIQATVERFGRLDALVNNASSFFVTPLSAVDEADWDSLFATNAKAPFFLAQAAAPHLRASRGAIVNLLDIYADRPSPELLPYSASKAALLALTKGLAVAMAPEVRVNGISPGAIIWPESGKTPGDIQRILDRTPLARTGTPEEVASAAEWLIRDATYTTGQVLCLDGGRTLIV